MLVLGIIIVLAVIAIGYFISTQRSLVSLDEMCKNALSQIEVQLNSRFDAVVALAKTAAKYAAHESETIIKTVEARGGHTPSTGGATPQAINQQSDLLGCQNCRYYALTSNMSKLTNIVCCGTCSHCRRFIKTPYRLHIYAVCFC